jgi:hypothetical protein
MQILPHHVDQYAGDLACFDVPYEAVGGIGTLRGLNPGEYRLSDATTATPP